jgi:hypothetical protein
MNNTRAFWSNDRLLLYLTVRRLKFMYMLYKDAILLHREHSVPPFPTPIRECCIVEDLLFILRILKET